MNFLQAEKISKSYGDTSLFTDLSLSIDKNKKIALIAKNGTGKSTLLRIIAGIESPDDGAVNSVSGLTIGFLPQEPDLNNDLTVLNQVMVNLPEISDTIFQYEMAIMAPTKYDLDLAISEMDRLEAWAFDIRVKEVLTKLKINRFDQMVGELSGGQRKRVALAQVLVSEPDLLILDEPTNHLDLDMIEWLEEMLSSSQRTVFMVTHDRYFLDRVCNEILEMADRNLYKYGGNYQYYLDKREERLELEQKRVDKASSLMKKELEWVNRMPKARGTKAKYRMESFASLKEAARKEYAPEQQEIQIEAMRLGKKVLEIENLSKSYDDLVLFKDFEYKFQRFERIGLIGPNGVGKTTFLKTITGQLSPDSGRADIGSTVRFGFYEQKGITFDPNEKVIEVVKKIAEVIHLGKGRSMTASQFLEYFLFSGDMQYSFVSKLSGGEKRRLYLCTVLMRNPNFLILDEPTNDLDIMTLNVLEDFLLRFSGCVMVVSHDRYFMDKVVDHLFVFEGNGVVSDFPGNYSIYRDHIELQAEKKSKIAPEKVAKVRVKTEQTKTKLSFKEKFEFEKLETEIQELENEKEILEKEINSGVCTSEELQNKSIRIGEIIDLLDIKELRWLELSEYDK